MSGPYLPGIEPAAPEEPALVLPPPSIPAREACPRARRFAVRLAFLFEDWHWPPGPTTRRRGAPWPDWREWWRR